MSVEDVCELGSMLQSGDQEKNSLERKLVELDGAIQSQDRRLNHEVDAEHWARGEQKNLLEHAINTGNSFEIASSVISQLNSDSISTQRLSSVLDRVNKYIILRDDLADDVRSVQCEIERLQEESRTLHDSEAKLVLVSIASVSKTVKENTAAELTLKQSLAEIKAEIDHRKILIKEKLSVDAYDTERSFPHLEQDRRQLDEKTEDLIRKTTEAQIKEDATLLLLQKDVEANTARVDELLLRRDDVKSQGIAAVAQTEREKTELALSIDENSTLLRNSSSTSEAEYSTAKEVDDAKKQLAELEKFSKDSSDELDRIRRAQTFEKTREEAFLKSQSGNSVNAQQICGEAERLKVSLELVRAEIADIKNQMAYEPAQLLSESVTNKQLIELNITIHASRTRSETALAAKAVIEQEKVLLNSRYCENKERRDAVQTEIDTLQASQDALLVQQEEYTESLHALSEQIEATSPPVDFETTSASRTLEAEELRKQILDKDANEAHAIEHSEALKIASVSHSKNIEAYSLAKKTQYVLDEKDRRLRASRQEKLSISAEALNVLQDELREEDDRFKEAVKAAEDSAILAEEKVVAVMNQVIEVGLQMIAERNNRKKEVVELEAELLRLGQEYEAESKTLQKLITEGHAEPPMSSQSSRVFEDMTRTSRSQTDHPPRRSLTKNVKDVRKGGRRDHDGGTRSSLPSSQHLSPRVNSWESSSPAAHLPKQQALSDDDEDALSLEAESSQTQTIPMSKRESASEAKSATARRSIQRNEELVRSDEVAAAVKGKPAEKGQSSGARMREPAAPEPLQGKQPSADSEARGANNSKSRVVIKRRLQQVAEGSKRSRGGAAAK